MDKAKLMAHMRSEERKKAVAEKMRELIDLTNCMSADKDVALGIYEGLVNSHRTLQQSFFRSFMMAMEVYKDTEWQDLRNKASVDFAKMICKLDYCFPMV